MHKEYTNSVIAHIQRRQLSALLKLRRFFQLSLIVEPRKQFDLAEADYLEPMESEVGDALEPRRSDEASFR
jgi:hypothetical protein